MDILEGVVGMGALALGLGVGLAASRFLLAVLIAATFGRNRP